MILSRPLLFLAFALPLYIRAELHFFRTEPTVPAPIIKITNIPHNISRVEDGFLFLAPFSSNEKDHYGPLIYDKSANLVWSGVATTGRTQRISNFGPCDYLGSHSSYLCWTSANMTSGLAQHYSGAHWVFDNTYTKVRDSLQITGERMIETPNIHELNVLHGGHGYLQLVWHQKRVDMSAYNGPKDGIVYDGCFQEIDMEKPSVVFEWCLLDHRPIWDTYMFPAVDKQVNYTEQGGGTGQKDYPWDSNHINSVDKNIDGDYLVSFRHLCQVIKVAGKQNLNGYKPGTILWRLGGKSSTVHIREADQVFFSTQHMARFVSSNDQGDLISLFNNNYRLQADHPSIPSSGQIIFVNNSTNDGLVEREYPHPDGAQAQMMGSTMKLSNGNLFIGWGSIPQFTEFAADGSVLLHGRFGEDWIDFNYRTYSAPWIGKPQQLPKIIAYKRYCDSSPLVIHVSWNGATEVEAWKVFIRTFRHAPWMIVGTFRKTGFETTINISHTELSWLAYSVHRVIGFAPVISLQALGPNGKVLATVEAKTFVPPPALIKTSSCDDLGCNEPEAFDYQRAHNYSDSCNRRTGLPFAFILTLLIAVFGIGYVTKRMVTVPARLGRIRPLYSLIATYED